MSDERLRGEWRPGSGSVWVLLTVAAAGAAIFAAGYFGGLGARAAVFGAMLAYPVAAAVALLMVTLVILWWAWSLPASRAAVLASAVAVGVVVAVTIGFVAVRPGPVSPREMPSRSSSEEVRVLAWNVLKGRVSATQRNELIAATDADVVVFPELSPDDPELAAPPGYQVIGGQGSTVTLFVADRLGQYERAEGDATSIFVAVPVSEPASPRIVAVHNPRMTLSAPERWQRGLGLITAACSGPNTIAAGDFNAGRANFHHRGVGACLTSGEETVSGTWPAVLPARLGTTIDHVLATSEWHFAYERALSVDSASDHRPVFAILKRTR
ncbi:MAG: endonuclease/exonuclease/phosphatase family protein [Propionibacteriaceae bacterium]|nr:endonuclease/exonuclease/phosphatase family protein [Propionibacteriaceae bacterium]